MCLIGSIVEGPPCANFLPLTATISFYVGRYSELRLPEDETKDRNDTADYARQAYLPAVKSHGQPWAAEGHFKVDKSAPQA